MIYFYIIRVDQNLFKLKRDGSVLKAVILICKNITNLLDAKIKIDFIKTVHLLQLSVNGVENISPVLTILEHIISTQHKQLIYGTTLSTSGRVSGSTKHSRLVTPGQVVTKYNSLFYLMQIYLPSIYSLCIGS